MIIAHIPDCRCRSPWLLGGLQDEAWGQEELDYYQMEPHIILGSGKEKRNRSKDGKTGLGKEKQEYDNHSSLE